MITVNEKFKIDPDGMGTYDLIQVSKKSEKEFQKAIKAAKSRGSDPGNIKKETQTVISKNVSLSHCANKMMHILSGDEASKNDIPFHKYIDLLKATKIQIDKRIDKQLNK